MRGKLWLCIWIPCIGVSVVGEAANVPMAVSPGAETVVATPHRCPTFSWGPVPGAVGYELIVYRIDPDDGATEPVLSHEVPVAALAWTPPIDQCLENGRSYGWTVRARTGEDFSDWAAPLLFRPGPFSDWGAPASEPAGKGPELVPGRQRSSGPVLDEVVSKEVDGAPGPTPRVAAVAGNTEARMTVDGEVRTVDEDGDPRLWGRGRPAVDLYLRPIVNEPCVNFDAGGVQYGLSNVIVEWGSAADACPAGTWVCEPSEVAACDTSRPDDDDLDALGCDGGWIDFAADDHRGWTARKASGSFHGIAVGESTGGGVGWPTCIHYPVWCCWK